MRQDFQCLQSFGEVNDGRNRTNRMYKLKLHVHAIWNKIRKPTNGRETFMQITPVRL